MPTGGRGSMSIVRGCHREVETDLGLHYLSCTVDSRYLELGYLEFCETRSIYLNQNYSSIAFFNHNLAMETFFTSPYYPKCKSICTLGNLDL